MALHASTCKSFITVPVQALCFSGPCAKQIEPKTAVRGLKFDAGPLGQIDAENLLMSHTWVVQPTNSNCQHSSFSTSLSNKALLGAFFDLLRPTWLPRRDGVGSRSSSRRKKRNDAWRRMLSSVTAEVIAESSEVDRSEVDQSAG